jgi:hypothetical protein
VIRFFPAALAAIAIGILAACSNTTGGGTTGLPPGQLPPVQAPQTSTPQPTASPNFATGQIAVGDGSVQSLPVPGDFRVSAAFPQSSASPIMVKVTVSVNGPGGIPAYGDTGSKRRMFGRHHTLSPALLYVAFSADKDVTLPGPPTLTFAVPVNALEPFGTDPIVDLALHDPAAENKWMQHIADRGAATPTPTPAASGSAKAAPLAIVTPTASPTPSPTPSPTATATLRPGQPPPLLTPMPTVTTARPPAQTVEYRFVPVERPVKLLAKKSLVYVLYAEPAPSPSPTGSAAASAAPKARASGSPAASAAPSGSPTASGSPLPSPSPT